MLQLLTNQFFSSKRKPKRKSAKSTELSFESLEGRCMLATFTVTNANDGLVDSAGDLPGSLRQAIFDANANDRTDTIVFSSFFDSQRTIDLQSQLPTITDGLTISGPGRDLLTLDAGNGTDNTFGTNDGYRIFDIDDGDINTSISVVLSGLTLTGGDTERDEREFLFPRGENGDGGAIRSSESLSLIDSAVIGNASGNFSGGGGAIFSSGDLVVSGSVITGNMADDDGGGINSSGSLTVNRSSITGNIARFNNGGGIFSSGSLTVNQSTIASNTSGSRGGGINSTGTATITSSTVSENATEDEIFGGFDGGSGGGIFSSGTLNLVDSTVSGNATGQGGQAYYVFGGEYNGKIYGGYIRNAGDGGSGGGIFSSGILSISSSTVSGNVTGSSGEDPYGDGLYMGEGGFGGGVAVPDGVVSITNSTITGNTAASSGGGVSGQQGFFGDGPQAAFISSTIIAGNAANGEVYTGFGSSPTVGLDIDALSIAAAVQFESSLIGDGSDSGLTASPVGAADSNGNLVGTFDSPIDPLLAPLASNGGPTQTHALQRNSPALDAGEPGFAFGFDQRGAPFSRTLVGRIDIGSFESTQTLVVNSLGDFEDDSNAATLSLREAIIIANSDAAPDTITFSSLFDTQQTIDLGSQLPTISQPLTINGPGQELLTLDAGNGADGIFGTQDGYRIFDISDGDSSNEIRVALNGLTLTGGDVSETASGGGAIRSRESLVVSDSTISGNTAGPAPNFNDLSGGGGGGIQNSGSLQVIRSTISNNLTGQHGGGGGIFSSGTLTVLETSIQDNATRGFFAGDSSFGSRSGGGIFSDGSLVISSSTISGNSTAAGDNEGSQFYSASNGGDGGGIFSRGSLVISNSEISGNTTGQGGDGYNNFGFIGREGGNGGSGAGIFSIGESVITGSTVSGNLTGSGGYGGVDDSIPGTLYLMYGGDGGDGGGVFASGALTLTNSTISGNATGQGAPGGFLGGGYYGADGNGGGIYRDGAVEFLIVNSTVTNNVAEGTGGGIGQNTNAKVTNDGRLLVQNSIIAGNSDDGAAPDLEAPGPNEQEFFFGVESSLIGDATGSGLSSGAFGLPDADGNIIGSAASPVDPLLSPLGFNGGLTQTHALQLDSPAVNAGNNSFVADLPTDQRGFGFDRVEFGVVDIGAFEFDGVSVPPTVSSIVRDEGGVLERPDLIETFSVSFDIDVSVSASSLQVRNDTVGGAPVNLSNVLFDYDPTTFTATWDFSSETLQAGFYSFELTDSIVSTNGNVGLDGNSNGASGGSLIQSVYVALPGDANLDGQVDVLGDAFALVGNLGTTDGASWAQGDFNGDGTVDVLSDAFILVGQLGQSVVPPMASAASSNRMTDTPRQLTAEPEKPTLMPVDESVSLVILQEGERQPTLPSSSAVKLALAGSQAIDDAFAADSLLDDGLF